MDKTAIYLMRLEDEIKKGIAEEAENGLTQQCEQYLHVLLENRKHVLEMEPSAVVLSSYGTATGISMPVVGVSEETAKASTWLVKAIENEVEAAEEYYKQWKCLNNQALKAICIDKLNHADILLKLASDAEKARWPGRWPRCRD